jgi:uncharacterized protein with HEPN domain
MDILWQILEKDLPKLIDELENIFSKSGES